jgi:formylglycine-generating enzyme required for sulfatase activity
MIFLQMFIAFLGLLFWGCGGDDGPTNPPVPTGSISIEAAPNDFEAPWQLTGPDTSSLRGAGNLTISEVAPGDYTLIWGAVEGWIDPGSSTQTLDAGATVSFSGTYYSETPDYLPGFVLIPPADLAVPATFTMGSSLHEGHMPIDSDPHQVTLTDRFYMASTEVTVGQFVEALQWAYDQGHVTAEGASIFDALDGSTQELLDVADSSLKIDFSNGVFGTSFPDLPILAVSWYAAVSYCDWLSLKADLPRAYDHSDWSCNGGNPYSSSGFRLPTEAEWEFACRAGTTTHFNTGDCLNVDGEANFDARYLNFFDCPHGWHLGHVVEVGSYPANQWNLHDLHGNVAEWCQDWYGSYNGDVTNPAGSEVGENKIVRGGSWSSYPDNCRSAMRDFSNPLERYYLIGFRPVR